MIFTSVQNDTKKLKGTKDSKKQPELNINQESILTHFAVTSFLKGFILEKKRKIED